jgi:octopine/nopaline transport system substrate-binding protein
MRILIAIASAVFFLASSTGQSSAEIKKNLVLGTEGAYKPWGYMENGTTLVGYEIDMMQEVCKRMSVKCEIVTNDFAGLIPALTAGKFDAIFAGMNSTEKRRQTIAFSRPYAVDPASFGLPKGNPLTQMPQAGQVIDLAHNGDAQNIIAAMKSALKGKVIGVQGSTNLAQFLQDNFRDAVTIREYNTVDQHDLDLAAGRLDGILAQGVELKDSLQKPELAGYEASGPRFFGGVLGDGISVGVRKEDTELRAAFDSAINSMIQDGTLKNLSMKWFGVDTTPKN